MKLKSFLRYVAPAFISLTALNAASDPWSLSTFQPVLTDSKLQAPTSVTACAQGDFPGFYADYFKLVGSYMQFEMSGDSNRSELRQVPEWKTSTTSYRKMIGTVKLFYPTTSTLNEYTYMQIHDSGSTPNKPLVRLVWLRSRNGVNDHIWSIRRTSVSSDTYSYVDLGARPTGFFTSEIQVINNTMKVKIAGVTKVSTSVSYWSSLNNYFKAGVYLQDSGTATVQFSALKYYYK
jgi:hypothetical protein